MQEAVLKVQRLGIPPEGFENDVFPGDEGCPTDYMSGIEWTVLHCIESVFVPEATEDFRNLIEKCNSAMMKDMLLKRLQNYISSRE